MGSLSQPSPHLLVGKAMESILQLRPENLKNYFKSKGCEKYYLNTRQSGHAQVLANHALTMPETNTIAP